MAQDFVGVFACDIIGRKGRRVSSQEFKVTSTVLNTLRVMEIKTEVSNIVIILCHYDTSLKQCVRDMLHLKKNNYSLLLQTLVSPCLTFPASSIKALSACCVRLSRFAI